MKALSIRQPWAWLIIHGGKDIENRTWRTRFRGRVLVHASKGMTLGEYEDGVATAESLPTNIPALPAAEKLDRGGIIGAVTITDCVLPGNGTSLWHMGSQFGFALADPAPIPFTPCRGALGFFDVPPEVASHIRSLASGVGAGV